MRVFVTGGSGFVGSRFIRILLKTKNSVYALSRKKKKSQKNLIWIKGRLDGIFKQLSLCDVLVHFSAAGVNNKNLSYNKIYKTNVIESSKLLINAANAGCLNWVIIGTSSEYGVNNLRENLKKFSVSRKLNPISSYAKTKYIFSKIAFKFAKKYNANLRLLRLFPTYGFGENKKRMFPSLIRAGKKGKDFIIQNSKEYRDFIEVNNACKKILKAIYFSKKIKERKIWNLTSGDCQTIGSFAKKIWKKYNFKGRLILKNTINYSTNNHCSDKSSIWK